MKKTIVICDNCDTEIAGPRRQTKLGDVRRDLCRKCLTTAASGFVSIDTLRSEVEAVERGMVADLKSRVPA